MIEFYATEGAEIFDTVQELDYGMDDRGIEIRFLGGAESFTYTQNQSLSCDPFSAKSNTGHLRMVSRSSKCVGKGSLHCQL
jgi:hypothetical protein